MSELGARLWNVEKRIKKGDYYYVIVREHPKATRHGYVLEHRVVVENSLGRLLHADEVVHHVNGDKKDNRPENLEVTTNSEHARHHAQRQGKVYLELRCPCCGIRFTRPRNRTHLGKSCGTFTACSAHCRGKFSREIQLHGRTESVEQAISVNIVKEFVLYDNAEETQDSGIRRDYTPAVCDDEDIVQPTTAAPRA